MYTKWCFDPTPHGRHEYFIFEGGGPVTPIGCPGRECDCNGCLLGVKEPQPHPDGPGIKWNSMLNQWENVEPTDGLIWGEGDWDKNPIVDTLKDLVREHGAVKIQNALDETTAGAFLEYCGTDAAKWAEQFCGMFECEADEGTMIGWFANAIEAGRAAGFNESRDILKRMDNK